MAFLSPLRYPGGKRKLANYIKLIFQHNDLLDAEYVEPYAGGAGVALALLYDEYVRRVHINDLDDAIYAFWHSVLNETEALCRLINDTPVNMEEWYRQQQVQIDTKAPLLDLGFSTFFLNRTNRSGIISGGVIGGKQQAGKWKLDARYNKSNLIQRIQRVARYRPRIRLYKQDAADFITNVIPQLPERTLIYCDPPYYIKGQQLLYTNYYQPDDHVTVARLISDISQYWLVSYDNVPEIRALYDQFDYLDYGVSYSAQAHYYGAEIMFFCNALEIPDVADPTKVKSVLQRSLFQIPQAA